MNETAETESERESAIHAQVRLELKASFANLLRKWADRIDAAPLHGYNAEVNQRIDYEEVFTHDPQVKRVPVAEHITVKLTLPIE